MCEHLHVLPSPGALLDQDSFLIEAMDMVVGAEQSKRELDELQAKQR